MSDFATTIASLSPAAWYRYSETSYGSGVAADSSGNGRDAAYRATTPTWGVTGNLQISSSDLAVTCSVTPPPYISVTTDATWMNSVTAVSFMAVAQSSDTTKAQYLVTRWNLSNSNDQFFGVSFSATGKAQTFCRSAAGTNYTAAESTGDRRDGNWHVVIGVFDGNTLTTYVDGTSVASSTVSAGAPVSLRTPTTGRGLTVGGASANASWDSNTGVKTVSEAAFFDYALTATQVATISASLTPTGTFAATEDDDTLAATGSVGSGGVTGTFAATEGNDTLTAAASEILTGTLAATEGADTLAAAGTAGSPAVTGTFAATEAADALAASGVETISGTLAATEAADTLAASGSETIVGTIAATEAADTLAASGAEILAGVFAATEAPDALATSGAETITGIFAATEAADVLVGVGTVLVAVTGTFAATEAPDTLVAVGSGGLVVASDYAVVRPLAHRIPVAERAHAAAVTAAPSAVPVAEADHAATVAARPHRIEA